MDFSGGASLGFLCTMRALVHFARALIVWGRVEKDETTRAIKESL